MHLYTTHRRSAGLFAAPDLVLVKDGFCWPAFFFGVLWALWQRMWITAVVLLAAGATVSGFGEALNLHSATHAALVVGTMAFIGFSANDWRRTSLARRGFADGPPIAASDLDAAEWRLLAADAEAV